MFDPSQFLQTSERTGIARQLRKQGTPKSTDCCQVLMMMMTTWAFWIRTSNLLVSRSLGETERCKLKEDPEDCGVTKVAIHWTC